MKSVNQNMVIDPVEEFLKVNAHHEPPPGLHIRLRAHADLAGNRSCAR